ncbi:MAG TPA: hypothetical protein VFB83_03765 [Propionibacteriaceae bacterium]|nr:hypothetical protein [Propionibacteriaceae bacterium]
MMSYAHASVVAAARGTAAFLAGSGARADMVRERAERVREMLPSPCEQSGPGSRSFTR